ncbi:MAG: nucleotidyltransferase domain-containing protein [Tepidisphaeraceae bacterium]|jgi:uncharacterized protein
MAKRNSKSEKRGRTETRGKEDFKPSIVSSDLTALCHRYGVRRLWLYGSILRPDFRPDSDIDVLVETDRKRPMGLFKLGGLQSDLVSMMGRPVHLTTLGSVPEKLRPGLLSSALLQYVA